MQKSQVNISFQVPSGKAMKIAKKVATILRVAKLLFLPRLVIDIIITDVD